MFFLCVATSIYFVPLFLVWILLKWVNVKYQSIDYAKLNEYDLLIILPNIMHFIGVDGFKTVEIDRIRMVPWEIKLLAMEYLINRVEARHENIVIEFQVLIFNHGKI